MKKLFDGVIEVQFSGFTIEPDVGDSDGYGWNLKLQRNNGLCMEGTPDRLLFISGVHNGAIQLKIELSESRVPIDDRWEDVVENSLTVTSDKTYMYEWGYEEQYEIELPAGIYRVRYSAIGMDNEDYSAHDNGTAKSTQEYLIQFWPEPIQPSSIIRENSGKAQYVNRYACLDKSKQSELETQDARELTPSELALIADLTSEQIANIDKAILSATDVRFRKAREILSPILFGRVPGKVDGIPNEFYFQRVAHLFLNDEIRARGNLKNMEFSEIKLSQKN